MYAVELLDVVAHVDDAQAVHYGTSFYALDEDVAGPVVGQGQAQRVLRFDKLDFFWSACGGVDYS